MAYGKLEILEDRIHFESCKLVNETEVAQLERVCKDEHFALVFACFNDHITSFGLIFGLLR